MKLRVITVSELNSYISRYISLDPILSSVKVMGEISNFKVSSLGHAYFTISDDVSSISCIMFKDDYQDLDYNYSDGEYVELEGEVRIYAKRGQYQIKVTRIRLKGEGQAKIDFEKLKSKLDKEGLFSIEHKKALPRFPRKIGVVTSGGGAALQDVISVLSRRSPYLELVIFPTVVQGEYAVQNIVKSLESARANIDIDALILTRGGGSDEDLSAFNDELVVRTLFSMPYPVISAIGHEIDFTLCDYVADMRAPTPSVAAELVAPDYKELINELTNKFNIIYSIIKNKIDNNYNNMNNYNIVNLKTKIMNKLTYENKSLLYFSPDNIISRINSHIKHDSLNLESYYSKLKANMDKNIRYKSSNLDVCGAKLHSVSPLSTLSRGYTLVEDLSSNIVGFDDVNIDDKINVIFDDGTVLCHVKNKVRKNDV